MRLGGWAVKGIRCWRRRAGLADREMAVLSVILLIGTWQLLASAFRGSSTLPPPLAVARAMGAMWVSGELPQDISASLRRVLVGLCGASVCAIALGVAAARYS